MAKVKYSEFVDALDAAAALDGTETVVVIQDGAPVETTTQDIADLGGGAAAPTVSAKTADFTANGASGTVYTNVGASGKIFATLADSAIGTEYTFFSVADNEISIVPFTDESITWFDWQANAQKTANQSGPDGMAFVNNCVTLVKISATAWHATAVVVANVDEV